MTQPHYAPKACQLLKIFLFYRCEIRKKLAMKSFGTSIKIHENPVWFEERWVFETFTVKYEETKHETYRQVFFGQCSIPIKQLIISLSHYEFFLHDRRYTMLPNQGTTRPSS